MQTQHDKLKAELEQAEAQNRLLQMRSSEQLAAAQRATRDREVELEDALKRAKEEAAQALVRLQAEHQAALEGAAAQKLDTEVRCPRKPAWCLDSTASSHHVCIRRMSMCCSDVGSSRDGATWQSPVIGQRATDTQRSP